MAARKVQASNRIIDQSVGEELLEQEQHRIRQGMRLHQQAWKKERSPKRTMPPVSGAILLVGGFLLGWAGSRFLDP